MNTNITPTLAQAIAKSREIISEVAIEKSSRDIAIDSLFAANDARRAYTIARRVARKANQVVSPMQAYLQ